MWIDEARLVKRPAVHFSGEFYQVRGAHSDVRPLQRPHPLFFGGASAGALDMGAKLCDVYGSIQSHRIRRASASGSLYAASSFGECRASMFRFGRLLRRPRCGVDKANSHPRGMKAKGLEATGTSAGPVDNAGKRLIASFGRATFMMNVCGCRSPSNWSARQ